jgi:hypothetical protein
MIIAIDFDGTCVTHEFPKVGRDIGAERVLKLLVENGHQLILHTMRSDMKNPKSRDYDIHTEGGNYLTDAVNWFKHRNIPLYGINENPTQKDWTTSPKSYANLYIDDASLGCPLIYGELDKKENIVMYKRPHVNWEAVEIHLITEGIIKKPQYENTGN